MPGPASVPGAAPVLSPPLPEAQRAAIGARLPQLVAVAEPDWLRIDAAYAAQLAHKSDLIARHGDAALASLPGSEPAQAELYRTVLDWLSRRADFRIGADEAQTPDGRTVALDPARPLLTLSRLVAEDLCLLERQDDGHVLTAAVLGFPAGWTLAQKIGRPLDRIHRPVPPYDEAVGRRVQRMFDNLPPGRIAGRANAHPATVPDLWLPRLEGEPKPHHAAAGAPWLRSEWQTVRVLPETRALVFTIHTSVLAA